MEQPDPNPEKRMDMLDNNSKKSETRENHIKGMLSWLKEGKKTPCCWPGCPHRNPKLKKYFKEPKNAK